jgi:outer membrane receptor for monomeric catechols
MHQHSDLPLITPSLRQYVKVHDLTRFPYAEKMEVSICFTQITGQNRLQKRKYIISTHTHSRDNNDHQHTLYTSLSSTFSSVSIAHTRIRAIHTHSRDNDPQRPLDTH